MINQIKEWVLDHSRVVLPVALMICVAITVAVALNAKRPKENTDNPLKDTSVPNEETILPEQPEELQLNAYPDVNAIIAAYYTAVSDGKVEEVAKLSSSIEETEKIRIAELSKYIESYPVIEVYTKSGPIANSYLAYVYTKVKFRGYDNEVPGMQAFYLCRNDDGTLYINEGEEEEYVTNYIQKISLQEDVVDLYNKMTVEYNELLVNDEKLGVFLKELAKQIDVAVGETLAAGNAEGEPEQPKQEPEAPADNTETQPEETVPSTATVTTTINVRSSDSETADKLGKLETGTKVKVLEMKPNGWTKIEYEKKEAYVKSEYLKAVEDASKAKTIGKVTILTNVNIRAAADETAEKLGVVYEGEKLDLLEEEKDGWYKVKYKDQAAYVKAEYVKK